MYRQGVSFFDECKTDMFEISQSFSTSSYFLMDYQGMKGSPENYWTARHFNKECSIMPFTIITTLTFNLLDHMM